MPQVPAGNLTGEYYIIVAGLPWFCRWQRLKDFARNQQPDGSCIEIDHALVFPDSTDGWVRVKGRENFKKALAHLNGGVLDHRAIIADGRNEKETVHLRDMAASCQPSLLSRHKNRSSARDAFILSQVPSEYQTSPASSYASSDVSTDQWYYPSSPSTAIYCQAPSPFTPTMFYPESPQLYDQNQIYAQNSYPTQFSPPTITYAGNMAPQIPIYLPSPQPIYTYAYSIPYPGPPTPPNSQLMPPPPPPPPQYQNHTQHQNNIQPTTNRNSNANRTIQTEARKLILTSLPQTTTTNDISTLITRHLTRQSQSHSNSHSSQSSRNNNTSEIENIEIARHSDTKSRGHAFVIMASHASARRVVEGLDGTRFLGRVLGVRFAKEGVEAHEVQKVLGVGSLNRRRGKETRDRKVEKREEKREGKADGRERTGRGKEKEQEGKKLRTHSCEPASGKRDGRSDSLNTPLVVCSTGRA